MATFRWGRVMARITTTSGLPIVSIEGYSLRPPGRRTYLSKSF